VDRLDQLFARSQREIEAHTDELGDTGTGRYFIDEAAQLLAALRLWAQSQYRSDRVVRDMLEAGDVVALRKVAHELGQMGTADAETASWTIAGMTNKSSGELRPSPRTPCEPCDRTSGADGHRRAVLARCLEPVAVLEQSIQPRWASAPIFSSGVQRAPPRPPTRWASRSGTHPIADVRPKVSRDWRVASFIGLSVMSSDLVPHQATLGR
jgi:hypothetical protein